CLTRPELFLVEPDANAPLSELETVRNLIDVYSVLKPVGIHEFISSLSMGSRSFSPDRVGEAAQAFTKRVFSDIRRQDVQELLERFLGQIDQAVEQALGEQPSTEAVLVKDFQRVEPIYVSETSGSGGSGYVYAAVVDSLPVPVHVVRQCERIL